MFLSLTPLDRLQIPHQIHIEIHFTLLYGASYLSKADYHLWSLLRHSGKK